MLKTTTVISLLSAICGAQNSEQNDTGSRNKIIPFKTDCRPIEDVLRIGGCFTDQFLCYAEDRNNATLLSPSDMTREVFLKTTCFCDPSCWKFKDCCIDVEPPESTLDDDVLWKCELLPGSKERIYMIASCPPDWNDQEEVDLCERRVSNDFYNYLLDIPVFSNRTGKAYSNVYCAKCHQDLHLYSFRVGLKCPYNLVNCQNMLPHSYYMYGEQKWQIYARGIHFGKYIYLVIPEFTNWEGFKEVYNVRRCRVVVDSCSNDNQFGYSENCTSGYASYINGLDRDSVYKNVYCTACNNVSITSHIKCFSTGTLKNIPKLYPSKDNCNFVHKGHADIFKEATPYSVLFDFYDPLGTNEVGLKYRCKEGEVLDPIHDSCVPFKCGKKFRKVGSACVSDEADDSHSKPTIHQNCRMLIYKKEEITILHQNNTIYINKTGLTYERSDFEEYDNDTYLICQHPDTYIEKFSTLQNHLSQIIMVVSLICLLIHIMIHLCIAKLRNLPGKNLLSLSVALFIAQALYLFGSSSAVEYPILCIIIAIVTHFCFLVSFFWMNVMAFDIYRTFTLANPLSNIDRQSNAFCRYAAYAWITPLSVILLAFIADYTDILPSIRPAYGGRICWLTHRHGLLVFFALPIAFLLAANIVFFLLTTYEIHQTSKLTRTVVQRKKDQVRFYLYVKLALIMGLTWVIGYVATMVDYEPFWYVFIVLNGSQGAFIFIAFSLKKRLISLAFKRLKGTSPEPFGEGSCTSNSTKHITASTKTSSSQE